MGYGTEKMHAGTIDMPALHLGLTRSTGFEWPVCHESLPSPYLGDAAVYGVEMRQDVGSAWKSDAAMRASDAGGGRSIVDRA